MFTATRLEVEPNAATTVPARARLWLDARAPEAEAVQAWRAAIEAEAARLAREAGVALSLRQGAWSTGCAFPEDVREALLRGLGPGAPRLVSYVGHDAGVIAEKRPAGMVLVRNETGISHSPDEDVDLADAAAGTTAVLAAVEALCA